MGKKIAIFPGSFDLVFIDADKQNYQKYFDLVLPKTPIGGYILADNVLWSGKVTNPKHDKDTAAIHAFNQYVANYPQVEQVILSVRDGITLCRKIG